MASSMESVELVSSTPKIDQAIADDTNGKNNGRNSVPLSPNVAIFAAAFASNSPNNTASSDSSGDQNAQSTTTISTDIRSNSEAHPRNWTREEVSRWFQSNKLDDLHNSLFHQNDPTNGATLDNMFKLKTENYDYYRDKYTRRLPSDQNNLLKDFDQFGQLLDNLFIDKYAFRFDVAFSYPGEIRDKVSQIADKLCLKINTIQGEQRVFYDRYHKVELARPNLDLYLQSIYRYQSRLIVVFMCDPYKIKEWCGLEERAIRSLLKARQSSRIMLLSVDGKTIEGISDIDGYWNIKDENEDTVAEGIYQRFKDLGNPISWPQIFYPPQPENTLSKMLLSSTSVFRSISPWYIVVALLSYILGTLVGR